MNSLLGVILALVISLGLAVGVVDEVSSQGEVITATGDLPAVAEVLNDARAVSGTASLDSKTQMLNTSWDSGKPLTAIAVPAGLTIHASRLQDIDLAEWCVDVVNADGSAQSITSDTMRLTSEPC